MNGDGVFNLNGAHAVGGDIEDAVTAPEQGQIAVFIGDGVVAGVKEALTGEASPVVVEVEFIIVPEGGDIARRQRPTADEMAASARRYRFAVRIDDGEVVAGDRFCR